MAERRMFSKTIIDSDIFLDMPHTAQLLYFHLAMRADDDGFINNPKSIMRNARCSSDDIKTLIEQGFIILFENGIVVVRHWKIHNYIRNDRYKETKYKGEKATLVLDENNVYVQKNGDLSAVGIPSDNQMATIGIPSDNQMDTQDRLGKDSIGYKDIVEQSPTPLPYKEIIDYLNAKTNSHYKSTAKSTQTKIKARIKEGATVEDFKLVIDIKSSQWMGDPKMEAYLRPETLFAPSHFESYLNEAKRSVAAPKHSGISQRLAKEISIDLADDTEFD